MNFLWGGEKKKAAPPPTELELSRQRQIDELKKLVPQVALQQASTAAANTKVRHLDAPADSSILGDDLRTIDLLSGAQGASQTFEIAVTTRFSRLVFTVTLPPTFPEREPLLQVQVNR